MYFGSFYVDGEVIVAGDTGPLLVDVGSAKGKGVGHRGCASWFATRGEVFVLRVFCVEAVTGLVCTG